MASDLPPLEAFSARDAREATGYERPYFGGTEVKGVVHSFADRALGQQTSGRLFTNPALIGQVLDTIALQVRPVELVNAFGPDLIEAAVTDWIYHSDPMSNWVAKDRGTGAAQAWRSLLSVRLPVSATGPSIESRFYDGLDLKSGGSPSLNAKKFEAVVEFYARLTAATYAAESKVDWRNTVPYNIIVRQYLMGRIREDLIAESQKIVDADEEGDAILSQARGSGGPSISVKPEPGVKIEPGFGAPLSVNSSIDLEQKGVNAKLFLLNQQQLNALLKEQEAILQYLRSTSELRELAGEGRQTGSLYQLVQALGTALVSRDVKYKEIGAQLEIARRETELSARERKRSADELNGTRSEYEAYRKAADEKFAVGQQYIDELDRRLTITLEQKIAGDSAIRRVPDLESQVRQVNAELIASQNARQATLNSIQDKSAALVDAKKQVSDAIAYRDAANAEINRLREKVAAYEAKEDSQRGQLVLVNARADDDNKKLRDALDNLKARSDADKKAADALKDDLKRAAAAINGKDSVIDSMRVALASVPPASAIPKDAVSASSASSTSAFDRAKQAEQNYRLVRTRLASAINELCRDQVMCLAVIDLLETRFKAYRPPTASLSTILNEMTHASEFDDADIAVARQTFISDLLFVSALLRGEQKWAATLNSGRPAEAGGITYVPLITEYIQRWTIKFNNLLQKRQNRNPFMWWSDQPVFAALLAVYHTNQLDVNEVDAAMRTVFAASNAAAYFVYSAITRHNGQWLTLYRDLCGILWRSDDFTINTGILINQPGGALAIFEFMRWVHKSDPVDFDKDSKIKELREFLEAAFVKVIANQVVRNNVTPVFEPAARRVYFPGNPAKLVLSAPSEPLTGYVEEPPDSLSLSYTGNYGAVNEPFIPSVASLNEL